jgi:DNA-directed RNA polymerase subunit L
MVKIKNLKIDELSFAKKITDKNFKRCLDYAKLIDPKAMDFLPKATKHSVSFELTDATTDFANCIRRSLMDEVVVYSMTVVDTNILTDDRFILADYLKKNIELVPFLQDITESEIKDLTISIDIKNTTDDLRTIYTGDIDVYIKSKKVDTGKYFSTTIALIQLRPSTFLKIDNITISHGQAKYDSGQFLLLSNISYEILDVVPLTEGKYETKGESSLNSEPAHFRIGYKTHRNIKPKNVMTKCCGELIRRFKAIQQELLLIKPSENVHFSDLIELETKGDVKLFHFKNEYWTVSNVISKYCFMAFKDIQFVCSSIVHPATEESVVKIRHTEPIKILQTAIKNILTDLNTVYKLFTVS